MNNQYHLWKSCLLYLGKRNKKEETSHHKKIMLQLSLYWMMSPPLEETFEYIQIMVFISRCNITSKDKIFVCIRELSFSTNV